MLHFDHKGHLTPYTAIPATIHQLETEFVDNIPSQTRVKNFENYRNYLSALIAACHNEPFVQWVNGSFTTKKTDPSDIDIVSFIDHSLLQSSKKLFEQFVYPNSFEQYEVDAYIVPVYTHDHQNNSLSISDRLYWMDNFNKTWYNRAGKRLPKGFLELKFNH